MFLPSLWPEAGWEFLYEETSDGEPFKCDKQRDALQAREGIHRDKGSMPGSRTSWTPLDRDGEGGTQGGEGGMRGRA